MMVVMSGAAIVTGETDRSGQRTCGFGAVGSPPSSRPKSRSRVMSTELSAASILVAGPGDRDAERVLAALRGNPDGMSRHEIRRRLFGANKPAESIAVVLATHQSRGLVRTERIEIGGRSDERWYAINAESRPAAVCPPPDAALVVRIVLSVS
jgi:hypothetical protein